MAVPSPRRVVITGVGVLSPIGSDPAAFWQSLCDRRSAVRLIQALDVSALPVRIAAELAAFDAKKIITSKDERKSLKMMARSVQMGVACAKLAFADTGIDRAQLDSTRFGVEFGSSLIPTELDDLAAAAALCATGAPGGVDMAKWGTAGVREIQPLWMLKYLPNMVACHVSIFLDAQGPNNSITETDAAGLLALGEAARILRRDGADFFLVGAADSKINALSLVRQCLFAPLSRRNDAPAEASRPFDRGRAGPGLARAIRAALRQAGVGPEAIDHINAHGQSTVEGDLWEARGLAEVFGGLNTPVFAAKSYFGGLSAAGGPVELVASLLAFRHGMLPATLNYADPDPACPVAVTREPRPVTKPYALKVSLTDLGQCAAAVVRKWEEM